MCGASYETRLFPRSVITVDDDYHDDDNDGDGDGDDGDDAGDDGGDDVMMVMMT